MLSLLINISLCERKVKSLLKKQFNVLNIHPSITVFNLDAIGYVSNKNQNGRIATSSELASQFSRIPVDHPIITV